jgi:hypothetical protein
VPFGDLAYYDFERFKVPGGDFCLGFRRQISEFFEFTEAHEGCLETVRAVHVGRRMSKDPYASTFNAQMEDQFATVLDHGAPRI